MLDRQSHLGAFGESAGRLLDVEALGECKPSARLSFLTAQGFQRFEVSDVDVADMALEAIASTLGQAPLAANDIDVVFLVTESFWDGGNEGTNPHAHIRFRRNFLDRVMRESGLERAIPYGIWGAACGSLMPAVHLARSQIAAGQVRNALIVAADRLPAGADRISPSGSVLFSDVACACLFAPELAAGFAIGEVVTVPSRRMLDLGEKGGIAETADAILSGMRDLEAMMLARTGQRFGDYQTIVFESFNQVMIDWIASALGIDRRQVRTPARARYAHAFSADLLLSLKAIATVDDLPQPEILVISFSTWILSATACVAQSRPGALAAAHGALAVT